MPGPPNGKTIRPWDGQVTHKGSSRGGPVMRCVASGRSAPEDPFGLFGPERLLRGWLFFVQNRSYREPPIRSRHSELGTRFSQTGKSQPLTRPVYPSGGHRMYLLGTFFGLYGWFLGGVVTRAAPPRDCRLIGHVPLFNRSSACKRPRFPGDRFQKSWRTKAFSVPTGPRLWN